MSARYPTDEEVTKYGSKAAAIIAINIPEEHQSMVALAANGQRNLVGGRPSDAAMNEVTHYLASPERYIAHQKDLSDRRFWQQRMNPNPLAGQLNGG